MGGPRLHLVILADGDERGRVMPLSTDVEHDLPRPSYLVLSKTSIPINSYVW